MKTMLIASTLAVLMGISIVQADGQSRDSKETVTRRWLFGAGTGNDPDKAAADVEAYNKAVEMGNAYCPGTVETIERTSSSCLKTNFGDQEAYLCSVTIKAMCVTKVRR